MLRFLPEKQDGVLNFMYKIKNSQILRTFCAAASRRQGKNYVLLKMCL